MAEQGTQPDPQRESSRSHTSEYSPWQRLVLRWKHGTTRQRTTIATVGVISAIVALVLIIAGARFVQWREKISQVRGYQQELTQTYDFNPGNIISDEQFFDGNAMSTEEVQAFLDEQGSECTGKTCLKSATFATETREATKYCTEYKTTGKQNAATIITAAARSCSISPKVLLTMLQKEQQLITATKPKQTQYQSAMGLSCPDDDACDTQYQGFFKQVFGSAERYQYYVHHEDDYGYHAGQLNYVQYNPLPECGGSQVYIENKATALLYIYTPYQPNIAALQAGAGEGDACSAYGNRNFSLIYSGWFGDPRSTNTESSASATSTSSDS